MRARRRPKRGERGRRPAHSVGSEHHAVRPLGAASRAWRATGLHEARVLLGSPGGRILVAAIALIAAFTAIGLLALWPHAGSEPASAASTLPAAVVGVKDGACPGPDDAPPSTQRCRTVTLDPVGPLPAGEVSLGPADGSPTFALGDRVRVAQIPQTDGLPEALESEAYSFVSIDRTEPLRRLALLLALFAVVALRVRGLLALVGVALSITLLTSFLVPAILAGHPPLLVALVGALAVMFVTLILTNGLGAQTLAGALGISLTLLLTTGLGLAAVRVTALDGSGSELSILLAQAKPGLSLEGVLLAGMVIGGLGVLADTAVTQASAVMALRRTDANLNALALYRRAVVIGRDHLAATIHTLVLAYAGTVLPLLLVLRAGATTTADTLNQTDIAEPVLATIVGCAGLIAAVPLTTALAALLVARIPAQALPADGGHVH